MPSPRRKLKGRLSDLDSLRVRERLSSGHDWDLLDGDRLNDDELAIAWRQLRGEIMARHLAERPGSRPWGWWKFDSREARRQIEEGPEPIGPADWFGCPSKFRGEPPALMYESERDYLARLGLLTEAEQRALASLNGK
jgi:hypothetical protein